MATPSAAQPRSKRSPSHAIVAERRRNRPVVLRRYAQTPSHSSWRNSSVGPLGVDRPAPRVVRGSTTTSTSRKFFAAARTSSARRCRFARSLVERRRRFARRLGERIEVDDHQVDQADAVAGDRAEVVGTVAPRQDAAVDLGVSVLTRPSIISGKPVTSETLVTEAGVGQRPRRAAGGDELEPAIDQPACQVDEPGFVRDAQQGSWHNR